MEGGVIRLPPGQKIRMNIRSLLYFPVVSALNHLSNNSRGNVSTAKSSTSLSLKLFTNSSLKARHILSVMLSIGMMWTYFCIATGTLQPSSYAFFRIPQS